MSRDHSVYRSEAPDLPGLAAHGPPWHRVVLWPLQHPWMIVAITVVCAAFALLFLTRIRADVSIEAMFAGGDPSAAALSHVLNDFPAADQLIVLATLPDPSSGPDPQRLLDFAGRFVRAIHQTPGLEQLTDGVFYQADRQSREYIEKVIGPAAMFYLDDRAFAAARERLTTEGIRARIAHDKALLSAPGPAAGAFARVMRQDPLQLHEFIMDRLAGQRPFRTYQNGDAFISPDGRSLLIRVLGRQPPNNLEFCRAITDGARQAGQSANVDGLKLEYTGSYAIATLSERSIRRDMIGSVIGSVVLLQLLFLLAYRSPIGLFFLAFGPVAFGILLGFGVYALFLVSLTPLTAVLGAILAGMGIDYSIQYISYYESRRATGASAREAAPDSVLVMSPAILAAWATSVVGFIAIGFSRVKALREFAILGSLGLTGAFLCAVAVLPAILMLADRRPANAARSRIRFSASGFVSSLSRRGVLWLTTCLLVLAGAVIFIGRAGADVLPLETDLTVMHPRPNPAIDAQYHIARRFGISPGSLVVYLHAPSPEELVELSQSVDARLKQPVVRAAGIAGSYGLATLLPDPRVAPARMASISQSEADRVVSDFQAALAESGFAPQAFEGYSQFLRVLLTQHSVPSIQSLLAYPRLAETILPASALRGISPTEAITLVFADGSLDLDRDREARDTVIRAARSALSGLNGATVTGLGVVSHDTEQTVRSELPRLIIAAVVIVVAYLAVHFRSLGDAALSLLPGVFGMIVGAAVLRLCGQRLNMVNLVAVPLLIGIDVDYGIFLVSLARIKRLRQESIAETVRNIEPPVHAVAMCAVATILGYVSLIWTSVPAERSLGIAAAAGIGACLIGVMFLLIPILFRLARRP